MTPKSMLIQPQNCSRFILCCVVVLMLLTMTYKQHQFDFVNHHLAAVGNYSKVFGNLLDIDTKFSVLNANSDLIPSNKSQVTVQKKTANGNVATCPDVYCVLYNVTNTLIY